MGDILYNFGQGFKRARKECGYKTQQSFVDAFRYDGDKSVCLETVRNWEQNRNIPEIKMIMTLCDFFNCDMDYLFFRIDCKNHNIQFIHDETGLSESAIQTMMIMKKYKYMDILNIMIENNLFNSIIQLQQAENNLIKFNKINEQFNNGDHSMETIEIRSRHLTDVKMNILNARDYFGKMIEKILPLDNSFDIF